MKTDMNVNISLHFVSLSTHLDERWVDGIDTKEQFFDYWKLLYLQPPTEVIVLPLTTALVVVKACVELTATTNHISSFTRDVVTATTHVAFLVVIQHPITTRLPTQQH